MLSNTLLVAVAILGAGVSIQSASAQSAGAVVAKDDTDKDSTLDLNEVKTAASAHFDKLSNDDPQRRGAEVQVGATTQEAH